MKQDIYVASEVEIVEVNGGYGSVDIFIGVGSDDTEWG